MACTCCCRERHFWPGPSRALKSAMQTHTYVHACTEYRHVHTYYHLVYVAAGETLPIWHMLWALLCDISAALMWSKFGRAAKSGAAVPGVKRRVPWNLSIPGQGGILAPALLTSHEARVSAVFRF